MSVLEAISPPKRGASTEVNQRLPEILNNYLRWHRIEGHTDDTVKHYRAQLGQFIKWLEAQGHSLLAGELTSMDILGHLEDMRDRGLRPKSLDTRLRDIRAWCHWMIDWEIIPGTRVGKNLYLGDPCGKINSIKIPRESKPFIKEHQFQALLDLCPLNTLLGARRQAMLWLMITSGVRRREMCQMQLADLDWDGESIRVMGKGQKERHIPFNRACQKVMLRYIHQRTDVLPCLWVTEEGTPLKYHPIGQDLRRLAERAGVSVKDVCHVYRRSFAAASVKQGIPDHYIRKAAGWSVNSQMLNKYTAWMEEEEEANIAFTDFKPF